MAVIAVLVPIRSASAANPVFIYLLNGVRILAPTIFTIVSTSPETSPNPAIVVTFNESPGQMTLQMAGGNITNDFSGTFAVTGKHWSGTVGVTEDAGFAWDVVSSTGSFTHINGPDAGDDMGGPMQFNLQLSGFNPFSPSKTVNLGPNPTRHPNNHRDDWTGSVDATVTIFSDISNWSMTLQATHVPEPEVVGLLGLGLAVTGVIGWRRRGSARVASRMP